MKLQDDGPIFTKQKVNFLPSDKILHLAVSSNTIVIAMANNILLRIDMKQPDKTEGMLLTPTNYFIKVILLKNSIVKYIFTSRAKPFIKSNLCIIKEELSSFIS